MEYLGEAYVRRVAHGPSWGLCMLPRGHTGPHVWTDPGQITISFP